MTKNRDQASSSIDIVIGEGVFYRLLAWVKSASKKERHAARHQRFEHEIGIPSSLRQFQHPISQFQGVVDFSTEQVK